MSISSSFRNSRSSLFFLTGIALAAGIAVASDGLQSFVFSRDVAQIPYSESLPLRDHRPLTAEERVAAETAWRYFENNVQPATGLVNSVDGFPSGTLWDQGSYVFALLAAEKLGLISSDAFHNRVTQLLTSFQTLPLFEDTLPNKVYHSETLQMVNYQNAPVPDGIGWSALDIARFLTAVRVLEHSRPEYGPQIRKLLGSWSLGAMAYEGRLQGASNENGALEFTQEGRIGYEQYGARAAAMWGLDTLSAGSAQTIMEWQPVQGIDIPVDLRRANTFHAITPTLSEPFFLQGLEIGFDRETATLASRVYAAQEQRYLSTGTRTMVSEDNIDTAPFFLYSSVYSNGEPWAVVSEDGTHYPELRTVSLKASFAWDALFGTTYTGETRSALSSLATDRGWMSGMYESDARANTAITANTNAVVLEALHYLAHGPLWSLD